MYKNTKHTVTIEANGAGGEGIARIDGYTVFVPYAVRGDIAEILIVKENKNFGYGKLLRLLNPSQERAEPRCPLFGSCGGCDLQHFSPSAQSDFKREKVKSAVSRIGGFSDAAVNPTVTGSAAFEYRNKVQYPVSEADGKIVRGFYAPRSHRVVPCKKCFLQKSRTEEPADFIISWLNENKISVYNEESGKGLVRRICVRTGKTEAVAVIVTAGKIPGIEDLAARLSEKYPYVKGLVENYNAKRTNTVYGERDRVVFGVPYILDSIGNISYEVHYKSFYQVNPYTTKLLYDKVRSLCAGAEDKTAFDLYCGTGTISLYAADCVKSVIGIEIVPEAVENARRNAEMNNIENASFYCGAAEETALDLISKGVTADIVIVDPPRKGCDKSLVEAIGRMQPERIIYVSCDCATMARDCAVLREYGYLMNECTPFDQFPQTCHVETVCLMSRKDK